MIRWGEKRIGVGWVRYSQCRFVEGTILIQRIERIVTWRMIGIESQQNIINGIYNMVSMIVIHTADNGEFHTRPLILVSHQLRGTRSGRVGELGLDKDLLEVIRPLVEFLVDDV